MAVSDDSSLRNLGTVYEEPERKLMYMRRRRVGTADRNGDPTDGLVNLWDLALILAVGFLVAALVGAGVSGLLTSKTFTVVTNPGTPQMEVIVKDGNVIKKLSAASASQVSGVGTLVGSFYKLADGTVIYVQNGQTVPGAQPVPGAGTVPGTTPTTFPTVAPPTVAPGASPAGPTLTPSPSPTVTLTPIP